jgi:hypothetical protein
MARTGFSSWQVAAAVGTMVLIAVGGFVAWRDHVLAMRGVADNEMRANPNHRREPAPPGRRISDTCAFRFCPEGTITVAPDQLAAKLRELEQAACQGACPIVIADAGSP